MSALLLKRRSVVKMPSVVMGHFRTHAPQQETSISRIGGWRWPMLGGATQGDKSKFCKLPAANADTLAGKRRQDADRCLKVPRIMPLLELL
jgi:hypothetical protein